MNQVMSEVRRVYLRGPQACTAIILILQYCLSSYVSCAVGLGYRVGSQGIYFVLTRVVLRITSNIEYLNIYSLLLLLRCLLYDVHNNI